MDRYTVTARVEVEVEMSIAAQSEEAARAIFDGRVIVTASLADTPTDQFVVAEASISEVSDLRIVRESKE